MTQDAFALDCGAHGPVSAIVEQPSNPKACLVLAHGAGAGMTHVFMATIASGLSNRHIATLRFNFPYMERGSKRPDPAPVAQAVIRSVVDESVRRAPGLPLFLGGKSFGGRMASQAQADKPIDHVRGLIFFGFPLHPAGKPAASRAAHLSRIRIPMLFLQGTRDMLADLALMTSVVNALDGPVGLSTFEDADHSFHVRARSGGSDAMTMNALLDRTSDWIDALIEDGRLGGSVV